MKSFLTSAVFQSADRAELNGKAGRGNFHSRVAMTNFLTWSFVQIASSLIRNVLVCSLW